MKNQKMTDESQSRSGTAGIITAAPITTHEQLEAAYQAAIRGRHISEIPAILALRNLGLEALSRTCPDCKGAGTVPAMTTHLGEDDHPYDAECPKCGGTGAVSERGNNDAALIVNNLRAEWEKRLGAGGEFWDGYNSFAEEAVKALSGEKPEIPQGEKG